MSTCPPARDTNPPPAGRRAAPAPFWVHRRNAGSFEKPPGDGFTFHEERIEVVGRGQAAGLPPEEVRAAARRSLARRGAKHPASPRRERAADRGFIGPAQLVGVGEGRIVVEIEVLAAQFLAEAFPEPLGRDGKGWHLLVARLPPHHAGAEGLTPLAARHRVRVLESRKRALPDPPRDRIAPPPPPPPLDHPHTPLAAPPPLLALPFQL